MLPMVWETNRPTCTKQFTALYMSLDNIQKLNVTEHSNLLLAC